MQRIDFSSIMIVALFLLCFYSSANATCPYTPTPISLSVNGSAKTDSVCIAQYQRFSFNAVSGRKYTITVSPFMSSDPDLYGSQNSDVSPSFGFYDISKVTRGGGISEVLTFTSPVTGLYYIAVNGYSVSSGTTVNYTVKVEDTTFLLAPALTSPTTGSTVNSPVPLRWSSVSGNSGYKLQIGNLPEMNISSNQYDATLGDGTYSWKVCTRNSDGMCGDWSSTWSFTVVPSTLPAPALTSPTTGSTVNSPVPLRWSSVSGNSGYKLQIGNLPEMNISSNQYDATLGDGTYSWKVCTRNSDGVCGDWSSTWSFTINSSPPPETPVQNTPIVNGSTVNLSWLQSGDYTSFYVQVSLGDASFSSNLVVDEPTWNNLSYVVTGLDDGTYYWRVAAFNGSQYSWSVVSVFTVTAVSTAGQYVPLFRLYKSYDNGQTVLRDHFYTTTVFERDNALNPLTYNDEGVECYIADGPFSGSVPLYRLYKSSTMSHFYTIDSAEKSLKLSQGYVDEGIEGYLLPAPSTGFVPLYRLRQTSATDDHYLLTTKKYEYEAVRNGVFGPYEIEGQDIIGYVPPESLAKGRLQANKHGVDLGSGHLRGLSSTDLIMKGKGLWLTFSHRYDSSAKSMFTPYPLGSGWNHDLESQIYGDPIDPAVAPQDRVPSDDVFLKWPDGRVSHFEKVGPGDSDYIDHSGRYDQLTRLNNGDEYRVVTKDQLTYRFLRYAVNPWPGLDQLIWGLIDLNPVLLYEVKDWAGNAITYDRGAVYGRINSVSDGKGRKLKLTYDAELKLQTVQEEVNGQNKRIVGFGYDANGLLSTFTNAKGLVTTYQYDNTKLLSSITYPRGNTVQITYDAADRVETLILNNDPATETLFSYPSPGLTSISDVNGGIFDYQHNNFQLTASPDVETIEWDLIHLQKPRRVVDKEQNATTFEYDSVGNVTKVINASGNEADYSYNTQNNLTSSTFFRPSGQAIIPTVYTYDATGNKLESITNPKGEITRFEYDPDNQLRSIENGLGYKTIYTYDDDAGGFGNLSSVQDAENNLTSYVNDYAGRTTQVTDAKGKMTSYDYDELDQLTGKTNHLNFTVNLGQNDNGFLESVVWTNSHTGLTSTTSYSYDNLDRLQTATNPISASTQFAWNGDGTLDTRTDPNNDTIKYIHDSQKRLSEIRYPGYPYDQSVSIGRNANGSVTSASTPLLSSQFQYNELNLLSQYTSPYAEVVQYQYNDAGQLWKLIYPGNKTVTYEYDAAGRLEKVFDWVGGVTTYIYDAVGNLKQIDRPNGTQAVYTYDKASRLTGVGEQKTSGAIIGSYTYGLDPVGNITSISATEPLSVVPVADSKNYSHDKANRLLKAGNASYVYDNNGNRTSKAEGGATVSYNWNYENLLTDMTDTIDTVQHVYDTMGNRVARIENGNTTRYVLDLSGDMSKVLCETDGAGKITAYYVYGIGLISRIDATDIRYFYHYNHRGDTIALSNDLGDVTDIYAYDEYGKLMEEGVVNSVPNPFKFVGRYGVMDEGNDLYFMRARFYDAEIGRFLSEDPLSFAGGDFNLFTYVSSRPTLFIDPLGLYEIIYGEQYAANSTPSYVLVEKNTTEKVKDLNKKIENTNRMFYLIDCSIDTLLIISESIYSIGSKISSLVSTVTGSPNPYEYAEIYYYENLEEDEKIRIYYQHMKLIYGEPKEM